MNNQDRTNNHAEAAHRRLQSDIDMNHPSIWTFVKALQRYQKGRDLAYDQYVRGEEAPKKRNKYIEADKRIKLLVDDLNNRTLIEFLRGIAHNFMMEP